MKKRYFAYIRVSTVKQGERGSSLAEQKSAIAAYAERNGLSIVTWFEEMETAAKQGRREFTRVLALLKGGKADGLVIHKIDRSARNLRDWADLGDLIDRGVDVRFVSDNFDLLSRGGRLSADIQAVVAADYIRNLREEVKKGMYGRLKQGIYPFAAPMGYLNTGKGKPKDIDPVKGPLIRRLFERYGTNTVSFEELRHEFARLGLTTSAGKPLAPNTLTNILNNPFYAGVIRIRKTGESFAGAHEPLVPRALFERVHGILRGKTVPKAKTHDFLFRKVIRCGGCGRRTLTGERQKGSTYYRCHGRSCRGVSQREDILEAAFAEQLDRIRFTGPEMRTLAEIMQRELRGRGDRGTKIKTALSLQLRQVESRLARLTDLLIESAIDTPTHNERREKLLLERQGLQEHLEHLDCEEPLQSLLTEFERNNGELLRYESLLDGEKRELVDILCSNFSVCGENITITLRTPYKEIAEEANPHHGAPQRDKVRTKRAADILLNVADHAILHPHRPHIPVPAFRAPDMGGLS